MTKLRTPLAAIRSKCRDCSNGSTKELRLCPVSDCALYPYRFGVRPGTAAKKQAQKLTENLSLN